MSTIRVGLIGLDHIGRAYLAALESDRQFDVVAVSDTSAERLRRLPEMMSAKVYADCRSLVVAQTRDPIDALFVALPPYQSLDLLPLAAERGLSLFCHAPVARTVEEARRVRKVFHGMKVPAVISGRWSAGIDADTWAEMRPVTGRVFAAHAVVHSASDSADWRGDSVRAGGGALLYDGYEAVHMLVTLVGLPELVSAECSLLLRPGAPAIHDTEDAAALAIRFGRDAIGSLAVCRGEADERLSLAIAGAEGSAEVSLDGVTFRARNSGETEHASRAGDCRIANDIARFADLHKRRPDGTNSNKVIEEHMDTLATIDAAYLSARTGTPESPAQFLEAYS